VAGYDIGSRIAQTLARESHGLVRALVVAPPLPGVGRRVLDPQARLDEFFSDITVSFADGAGHFAPLECPAEFATAIRAALAGTELAFGLPEEISERNFSRAR
jgi:pimeloyl-ACP methyl ester carboxylesterase